MISVYLLVVSYTFPIILATKVKKVVPLTETCTQNYLSVLFSEIFTLEFSSNLVQLLFYSCNILFEKD